MKKLTTLLSFALIGIISAGLLLVSCSKDDDLLQELSEIDAAVEDCDVMIPANFGVYKITQPGVYCIQGTVTGQYFDISAPDVTIKGVGNNPVFKGKKYPGKRSQSHFRGGSENGSLTIKDFTVQGKAGHNVISVHSANTLIENLTVYNATKAGAGGINPGPNSLTRNCYINPHDDAIKPTEPNARAEDLVIVMDGNGSAIQLGWGNRGNGAIHHVTRTKISGYVKNNGQTDCGDNPGRSIIGGFYQNNASDLKFTDLDINMSSQSDGHYCKIKVKGATVNDIEVTGVIRNTVKVKNGLTPFSFCTTNGGKINNVKINFGNKIKASHVRKDGGVSNLVIGGTSPCDNDPKPTGEIISAEVNAQGAGVVTISASDNGEVESVEVFEGTQSRGSLTAPNSNGNYQITSANLIANDAFTVVITDDCGKTTTLSGTIDGVDPCETDPAPTGEILVSNLNAAGNGRVKVSASDNSSVVRVEVFEGTASRGFLTAPNAGADYKIISAALDDQDNYTVVITDDCDNTTTLPGTINGGTTNPCTNDPAPTGSIVKTDYNNKGDGRVVISAADNGNVVSVEVFKGTNSMGKLTQPNVPPNYRIVNKALNPGNSFTVVITDDCDKTTTLNGTMP